MQRGTNPGLKAIISEASVALSRLDAEGLEGMARWCEALLVGYQATPLVSRLPASEVSEASREVAIFRRLLQATNSNLQVMCCLCARRAEQLEYGSAPAGFSGSAEGKNGVH